MKDIGAPKARGQAMLRLLAMFSLLASSVAFADTTGALSSQVLMSDLESFIHQRGGDASQLTPRSAVELMVDWYRFAAKSAASEDVLVFRYGGWSEGCATGFKFSVLRRVAAKEAAGTGTARFAGVTLMFEPSSRSDLAPYSTTSGDWQSIEEFVGAIKGSPAFKGLDAVTPMSAMIEGGGLR